MDIANALITIVACCAFALCMLVIVILHDSYTANRLRKARERAAEEAGLDAWKRAQHTPARPTGKPPEPDWTALQAWLRYQTEPFSLAEALFHSLGMAAKDITPAHAGTAKVLFSDAGCLPRIVSAGKRSTTLYYPPSYVAPARVVMPAENTFHANPPERSR